MTEINEIRKGDVLLYENDNEFQFYRVIGDYTEVKTKYDFELENTENSDDCFAVSRKQMMDLLRNKYKKVDMRIDQIQNNG